MTKRTKSNLDAAPPIGEKLLTLREAADVLRLSTRTLRDYLQRRVREASEVGFDTGYRDIAALRHFRSIAPFFPHCQFRGYPVL